MNKIIINEVAWMGTKNSANDEWIELKNISNKPVNLSGWQLSDKGEQIKIIFNENSIIPINGFYLLERTDDNSVPDITADFIYTGVLNDNEEELYLFNEKCELEDKIVAEPNWPAGDKSAKKSMQRDNDLSWYTYHGYNPSGVLGTPRKRNSFRPFFTGSGGGSNNSNGSSLPEESTEPYIPPKILITEIQIDGEESFYDFVEFYNPATSSMDISDFQLKKKSFTGKDYSVRVFPQGSIISGQDYFLWGNSNYVSSTQTLVNSTFNIPLAAVTKLPANDAVKVEDVMLGRSCPLTL